MSERMKLGELFEKLAEEDFLRRFPGSLVLERNVRFKVSEIDRVFLHKRTIHFVEVRGRLLLNRFHLSYYRKPTPEALFSQAKKMRMKKAIQYYLQKQSEVFRAKKGHKPPWNSIQIWLAIVFQDSKNQQNSIEWFQSD
jgi:Holliday junction resolvase-like predicted endonuclease